MVTTGGTTNIGSYLIGDDEPELMDFSTLLTPQDLMTLLVTSSSIQKQCIWLNAQALAAGWIFKKEESFTAEKRGKPYNFPSFTDWFHWCGAYEEVLKAMVWASLFRRSIIVGFLSEEKPTKYKNTGSDFYDELEEGAIATKLMACYDTLDGNGFKVEENDDDGEPLIYAIDFTQREPQPQLDKREKITYYVHKSRVVKFNSTALTLGFDGTSKVHTTAHLAMMERHFYQSIFVQCKNMSAGITAIKVASEDQKNAIKSQVSTVLAHTVRLWYKGSESIEDIIKVLVPDMKSDQIERISLLLQKRLANAMNISIRYLGEEDIATGIGEGGAGISHLQTKFEIMEIQRHYKRAVEEVFFLLGKTETEFEWNQPMQKDEEMLRDQGNINLKINGENNPDDKNQLPDEKQLPEKGVEEEDVSES